MGTQEYEPLLHWNYFLALESDLQNVSRFIEFSEKNFGTYSIELAHLLLASASEVDVVCKAICKILTPEVDAQSIDNYREIITHRFPDFLQEKVYISKYGRSLTPWERWDNNQNPLWWKGYNDVKHHRNEHFEDANLRNVINSMCGLLISVFYLYKLKFSDGLPQLIGNKDVTLKLKPKSTFLTLPDEYYNAHLLLN